MQPDNGWNDTMYYNAKQHKTQNKSEWKKRSEETQTLRAGCSKAEPKIFAPPQTPFPGARDGQNLTTWRRSLPLPIQTQFGEDRCTQFRVIVVTDPPTHPHTNRQDRLQYTAPQLARSVITICYSTVKHEHYALELELNS